MIIMKKIFALLLATMAVSSLASGQFTKAGAGLGFTTGFPFHQQTWENNQSSKIDLFAKGIYEITLPLHISPSFTWIVPHITKSEIDGSSEKTSVSAIMFDINGHYVFNSLDRFEFYGLAGHDIMLARKKFVSDFSNNTYKSVEKDNALGLNVGLGTYIKVTNQFDIFVEAKYLVSKYDQFMVNAGLLLNLEWLSKNENPGI